MIFCNGAFERLSNKEKVLPPGRCFNERNSELFAICRGGMRAESLIR